MNPRLLAGVAAAVAAAFVLCAAGIGGIVTAGAGGSGCDPPTGGSSTAVTVPTGHWDGDQIRHAATIVAVGIGLGVPPRGLTIAVATAMQESGLRNVPSGPGDSVGLFQQRPSHGWGTPAQLMDPTYAATAFYRRLLQVPGWQAMPLTDAAQAVQRSAYPDAYARWEAEATALVAALTGAAAGCAADVGPSGWVAPVRAPLVSGFRTAQRPGHDGVDLGAARGTPVRAAAAGTVAVVRCNVVPVSHGCDRDGSPATPGCGWYLDIVHPGGVVTRFCDLLTRPAVVEGQPVAAGQVIGLVGSSGHSSGPHLHFEVHLGGHSAATAIDPVPFMASNGAPLGGTS